VNQEKVMRTTKRDISLGEEPDPENVGRTARHDHADAFLPDPDGGPVVFDDDLAETLGEGFVRAATMGGDGADDDDFVSEEIGGPFVETTAREEFGAGRDESNPEGATREPLPRAVHGIATSPIDGDDDELSED